MKRYTTSINSQILQEMNHVITHNAIIMKYFRLINPNIANGGAIKRITIMNKSTVVIITFDGVLEEAILLDYNRINNKS